MQQVPDPYRALGVSRGASDAEIKAAHRKLAKRYHPDADGGDTRRFLGVQEAYRVLSDPLLRREWDARHAPGPVRADRPVAPRRRPARQRQPKPAAAQSPEPGPGRPRSSRAYTWSASEVPWWEEGARRDARRAARERPAEPETAAPDMDVYNRSSGAAWSMAARAYFRRGDQDLPRRGAWHYQGTQPLTGARARAAAEAEARRQGAAEAGPGAPTAAPRTPAPSEPAYAYASAGVAHDAHEVARARQRFTRRMRGEAWPSVGQRLLLGLLAWLPLAGLIAYFGTNAGGEEVGIAVLIALTLAMLVAVPRLAYFAALGTVAAVIGSAITLSILAILGARLPLSAQSITTVGIVAAISYVAVAGGVLVLGSRARPWSR